MGISRKKNIKEPVCLVFRKRHLVSNVVKCNKFTKTPVKNSLKTKKLKLNKIILSNENNVGQMLPFLSL